MNNVLDWNHDHGAELRPTVATVIQNEKKPFGTDLGFVMAANEHLLRVAVSDCIAEMQNYDIK
jgi:hypothetical protein